MKYIIDAHFDLLTDVAVRRKNGVLDMKAVSYTHLTLPTTSRV